MGDAKGSLKAYEDGLKAEGGNPSPGMQKGYEAAKKRVEEELESAVPAAPADDEAASSGSSSAGGSRGMPDLSSLAGMFGGGKGPGGFDLGAMMNNPMVQQMASKLMSNPSAMENIQNLMGSGAGKKAQESLASGQLPDFSELANDPKIQEMYRKFTGGGSQ
jgi:small glutamine-rich tetratricopeptide repeat-containing protein alpha